MSKFDFVILLEQEIRKCYEGIAAAEDWPKILVSWWMGVCVLVMRGVTSMSVYMWQAICQCFNIRNILREAS